jgi:hypothetical protein
VKAPGWFLGCGATFALVICLGGLVAVTGGSPFNPGALSAEHPQARAISGFVSHADFEARCELCHTPFVGPDPPRCTMCHTDVRDQIASTKALHGQMKDPNNCIRCHTDHTGRTGGLTRASLAEFPHEQYGFTLVGHQHDYRGAAITCHTCHGIATPIKSGDVARVMISCMDCHGNKDAQFLSDHRREMGDACLDCHDGSDRMKGFNHATVFALVGKHAQVACAKCHVNGRYPGTPRDCAACHADPQVHRGKFGTDCAACHTTTAWRPASLFMHTFPLDHGNMGKASACAVCHPTAYATDTCYGCHAHTPAQIANVHLKANIRDYQNCAKCHPTGKKKE